MTAAPLPPRPLEAERPTPLHVMHVVTSLNPGGTEALVVALSQESVRHGQRATVCCLDEPGQWAGKLERDGVEVFSLARPAGFSPRTARRLSTLVARLGVDVLHLHQYSPFVYGCLAASLHPRVRVVYTEHGRLFDDHVSGKRRLATPLLALRPRHVCAVAEDLVPHMRREGFWMRHIEVIRNGIIVDAATVTPVDLPFADDASVVIGAVGRLEPVKNFGLLIDAFELILHDVPGARLAIVGEGTMRDEWEARAGRSWAASHIHFLGHRDDIRALLRRFDVLANTSTTEGTSLTILEAMAEGRPVIATAVGGTPAVVADGVTGVLVEPGDPAAFARAAVALLTNTERRIEFGLAGAHIVANEFSFDRMFQRYLAMYTS